MARWAQDYFDAWNTHQGAAVAEFMAEDVIYEDLASGQVHEGRAGVEAFVRRTEDVSQDFRFTLVTDQRSGDQYAFEWEMAGTHTGPGAGVPATGRSYRIRGVSIGQLDGKGKIRANHDYWNLADLLVQLGVLPPPGMAPS